MKKIYSAITLSFFLLFSVLSTGQITSSSQWTWVKGDNTINQPGVYGTLGAPDPANKPGSRQGGFTWTDNAGNFWLFGGSGYAAAGFGNDYLNDLWKYNPASNQWTYMNGAFITDQAGVYGVQGVAAPANRPGARYLGTTWTDASNNLWLFGGFGYDGSSSLGDLNDLWKYDPATNNWTWVKGDNVINQAGVYGIIGTPAASNKPGGRQMSGGWKDNAGNFWLFGGNGYDVSSSVGYLNDLWRYNPGTNQWAWIKGDNVVNQAGIYGTQGVAAAGNKPGSRQSPVTWIDASNIMWLFGGNGYDASSGVGELNDLWKYDPISNQWTWLKGANVINQPGVYGTQGVSAAGNTPGGRYLSVPWTDASGNFWLFGGYAHDIVNALGDINDLWRYNPTAGQWTWIKGDNVINQTSIYGTLGTPSASNKPGARQASHTWRDASGTFWLFGGFGFDASVAGYLNDLWKLGTGSVLPVTLFNVKGYQKNAGIQIEWATQQEINIDRYEVEVSNNGVLFTKLGTEQAKGNSSITTYGLFDQTPSNGVNFYRVKIVDKSGQVSYSQVIRINISANGKNFVNVYPNPIIGKTITLQLNLQKGIYTLSVTNKLGEQMVTKALNHPGGSASESIELPQVLASGVYQLMVTGEGTKITNQVIKN